MVNGGSAELDADLLLCPITQEPLVSPVTLACGHTFSKTELRRVIKRHETDCPMAAPLPALSVLPSLGPLVTLGCGHVYDRDLIRPLREMGVERCVVCGPVLPHTCSQLATNKSYAKIMRCLAENQADELELLGPGDALALQEEEASEVRGFLTCGLTGELLREPISLPCGCTFSRHALLARVEQGDRACPTCARHHALPCSTHALHVNMGLAGIVRALTPPVVGGSEGEDGEPGVRPLRSMEEVKGAMGGAGGPSAVVSRGACTAGFLPPSSLAAGRGVKVVVEGGGRGGVAVESEQLDFLVGYQGEREGSGLPHGQGQWTKGGGRSSYRGQWVNGRFEGVGTLSFDGCVYTGGWLRGRSVPRHMMRYVWMLCEQVRPSLFPSCPCSPVLQPPI